jgi:hypothetical protein
MSLKCVFYLSVLMLFCSSCVSRTISEPTGLNEDGRPDPVKETKLIWIWEKEFRNP